jgi:Flp pilus assembly protein TadG
MPRAPIPLRASRALRRFAGRTSGALAVDSVLMMPVLLLVYTSAYVWYDGFRVQNLVQKATYTLADMIGRETVPMTDAYLDGLRGIGDFMTQTPADAQLRVTSLRCLSDCGDEDQRQLDMCWSWASGTVQPYDATSFAAIEDRIPLMVLGDTVVITEMFLDHDPVLPVMEPVTMSTFIVMRPRFAPQVLLDDQSCY